MNDVRFSGKGGPQGPAGQDLNLKSMDNVTSPPLTVTALKSSRSGSRALCREGGRDADPS